MSFTTRRLLSDSTSQYRIPNSLRFRSSASAYLSRTPSVAGNRTTWTWSGWVKRGTLTDNAVLFSARAYNASPTLDLRHELMFSGGSLSFGYYDTTNSPTLVYYGYLSSTSLYRDPSAWYHIVAVWDTTNSTASDRLRLFVNGVRLVNFSFTNNAPLNQNGLVNDNTRNHGIGAFTSTGAISTYFDGYLTEVNFIDGQALDPLAFGNFSATTGVWTPARYTGTYGTNGFYLKFTDTSSNTATGIGKDSSGNGNNWTPNNISLTAGATYDSMIDTPTNNFPVWNNVMQRIGSTTNFDGNLRVIDSSNSAGCMTGTFCIPNSEKWYFEIVITTISGNLGAVGVAVLSNNPTPTFNGTYRSGGTIVDTADNVKTSGATYASGDIIGVAVDADLGTVQFYKNGIVQGATPSFTYSVGTTLSPIAVFDNTAGWKVFSINFGQRPFAYTPPTGFKTLCTQNLPTPAIVNPAQFMAATTYAGTGATQTIANTVNNRSFQPDLVWIKGRSAATDHALYDSVRGATKDLANGSTSVESTQANGLTTFGSNGFSIGNLAKLNTNAQTYVAWQWKAGDSTVTNTAGTITSQVDANPTAGFSIVSYAGTGAGGTVGHGLGAAPKLVIVKNRATGTEINWRVWPGMLGASGNGTLYLDSTSAIMTASVLTEWGNANVSQAMTNLVLSIGTNNSTSSNNYIAYCFAEVDGYSKFGSYTGNGSADGPFVYCGFRPKWVMIKRTDAAGDWYIHDASRDTYNAGIANLAANLAAAESSFASTNYFDCVSNGFKLRQDDTNGYHNASGGTYIFAAFAEAPFKYALAR